MSVEGFLLDEAVGGAEGAEPDDILAALEHDLDGLDITSQGDEVLEQAAEYMEKHLDDSLIQQAVDPGDGSARVRLPDQERSPTRREPDCESIHQGRCQDGSPLPGDTRV